MVILETDVKKSMNFPIADFSHLQQKVRLGTQRASVKPIGVRGVDKKRVNSRQQEQKPRPPQSVLVCAFCRKQTSADPSPLKTFTRRLLPPSDAIFLPLHAVLPKSA